MEEHLIAFGANPSYSNIYICPAKHKSISKKTFWHNGRLVSNTPTWVPELQNNQSKLCVSQSESSHFKIFANITSERWLKKTPRIKWNYFASQCCQSRSHPSLLTYHWKYGYVVCPSQQCRITTLTLRIPPRMKIPINTLPNNASWLSW